MNVGTQSDLTDLSTPDSAVFGSNVSPLNANLLNNQSDVRDANERVGNLLFLFFFSGHFGQTLYVIRLRTKFIYLDHQARCCVTSYSQVGTMADWHSMHQQKFLMATTLPNHKVDFDHIHQLSFFSSCAGVADWLADWHSRSRRLRKQLLTAAGFRPFIFSCYNYVARLLYPPDESWQPLGREFEPYHVQAETHCCGLTALV